MSDWKPGDVAMIPFSRGEERAFWTSDGWVTYDVPESRVKNYSDVRPLVVIDPEDREAVERLADLMWSHRANILTDLQQVVTDALREYANPKPPRPDEPQGLGAVVEDANGLRWTRVESGEAETRNPWYPALDPSVQPAEYAEINAVRVLSPGVEVDQ